jgi:PIN domain nuclease of toxin-antitoxin system
VRLLLDTHALIWWLAGDPSLSTDAKAAIIDPGNEVFVSAVSAWEIATKYRIGSYPKQQTSLLTSPVRSQVRVSSSYRSPCCTDKRTNSGLSPRSTS